MCAMRSHDKQALRRLSTAVNQQSELKSIEVSLGPLDISEIRSLMANLLVYSEKAIPDALCTDIFQRTGGLPVYVVQLLEDIKRNKTVELDDGILKLNADGLKEKVRVN
jgi:predicted ATPase